MKGEQRTTMIRGGWSVTAAGDRRVSFRTCDNRDYGVDAKTARAVGEALIEHADRAEKAAAEADVEELALILRVATPGMAPGDGKGDYGLAVCRGYARAVLDAGYRKQGPT